ncbi:hypothetical protein QJS04_geneDACA017046 [Acorus gramineus]|uniref:Uncharacterized protein n=1 Tax=Acorus gramineus TaxID=55184 RepID=A0AAV9AKH4_ACOGR|nr:hypothetical protein QJS04_geneDACA017046 [Acorus gramineus]
MAEPWNVWRIKRGTGMKDMKGLGFAWRRRWNASAAINRQNSRWEEPLPPILPSKGRASFEMSSGTVFHCITSETEKVQGSQGLHK